MGTRLTGIVPREAPPRVWKDRLDFPEFEPPEAGIILNRRLACNGPLSWNGKEGAQADIDNFRAALQGVQPTEAFIPAVSPGTLAQSIFNDYYDDERAFLFAVAEVMKEEYRGIIDAGFLLQIDSPDLAMGMDVQLKGNKECSIGEVKNGQ